MEDNSSQQFQNQSVLINWLKILANSEIPFNNTSKIEVFEIVCVWDFTNNEAVYCPFLSKVSDNGNLTMMTFISPTLGQNCDFAYTAPAHWIQKMYDVELFCVEDFEKFQSKSIIEYITVFMNKMICYSDEFILYHDKISKEGPNKLVDELVCIFDYVCRVVEKTGVDDLKQQLSIASNIVDSFFNYFEVPKPVDIIFMAFDRIKSLREQEKMEKQETVDMDVWHMINELEL